MPFVIVCRRIKYVLGSEEELSDRDPVGQEKRDEIFWRDSVTSKAWFVFEEICDGILNIFINIVKLLTSIF